MISYQVSTPLRKYPFTFTWEKPCEECHQCKWQPSQCRYLLTGEWSQPSALYTTPYWWVFLYKPCWTLWLLLSDNIFKIYPFAELILLTSIYIFLLWIILVVIRRIYMRDRKYIVPKKISKLEIKCLSFETKKFLSIRINI